ncbi:MAG TPA: peptide chain release factor N(5)-glutamine methyltransferase [Longimicrobiales bacterium]|nr:peptide chain release factor N(5)-glutamine methyltransferase [Longimicrobiales bacterium]
MPERALDLTRKAASVFGERGFENPRLEAELLLAGVLGVKRLDLYLQHERPVAADELERYRDYVRRRLRREPLQYILGTAAFRTLDLAVDPRVLIPRPETEVLVGEVLAWAARCGRHGAALDVGTGSGAIALSLAAEGSFAGVIASDVSPAALDVARANAARNGLEGRVEFREGSSLDVVRPGERFTVIVSNPPYVADGERGLLPPEVRDHEPSAALFAGPDGLAVIADLVRQAPPALEGGGLLALEVGVGQADAVLSLMEAGGFAGVRIVPDLTGRLRVVLGERAEKKQQEREKAG